MSLYTAVFEKYQALNKIFSVMLEVTHRCPCDCVHCLLAKHYGNELTIDEISDIFRQMRQEGTINLGISGGEPFMRDDLPEILEEARKSSFIISILSSGATIDRAGVNLIKKNNISRIEISLMGAKPETHDSIMNHEGAFKKMLKAVKMMRSEGINVLMKATLLRQNCAELDGMAQLCKSLGTGFLANVVVSPRIDGDKLTQVHMLSNHELMRLNPDHIDGGLVPGENTHDGATLCCNAGKISACISPQGDMYPCVIMREKVGSTRERTIQDIWHDNPGPFLKDLRATRPEDASRCYSCESRPRCKRCPGIAYLETGSIIGVPASSCRMAGKIQE